jgi:hypothetical protein
VSRCGCGLSLRVFIQTNADSAYKLLDAAHIPYFAATGNHDYIRPMRYRSYCFTPYWLNSYPANSNENFYAVVSINGQPLWRSSGWTFAAIARVPPLGGQECPPHTITQPFRAGKVVSSNERDRVR